MIQVQPVDAPVAQVMSDQRVTSVSALMGCQSLKIKQKASFTEAVTGGACEKKNRYKIKAKGGPADGKKLYKAKEESECFMRMCCAPGHEARILIKEDEDFGDEVAYTIYKPFKCASCCSCLPICQSEATVYRGEWEEGQDNEVLGRVQEVACGGVFTPTIDIFDGKGGKKGQLKGPMCCIGSCCDTKFSYMKGESGDETDAHIKKDSGDLDKELLTDADTFKLKFTDDMDEAERATMLGAMLLLDFMFFEDDGAFDMANCEIKFFDWFCCGCTIPCKLKLNNGGA